jgi:uncharacterized ferredoxin-like protein
MDGSEDVVRRSIRRAAELCSVAAITAPKSGGQLFLRGSKPFLETVIVDDAETRRRLAEWLRERGRRLDQPIWLRDAETAERTELHLFLGLAQWYPPVYDCGACGYPTCAEFLDARARYQKKAGSEDWEFAGPICQLRCVDLGIAVGSAAKVATLHNIDARCQTRVAAAARHLGLIRADLAVSLSMSVSHKNVFFDRPSPDSFRTGAPDPGAPGVLQD